MRHYITIGGERERGARGAGPYISSRGTPLDTLKLIILLVVRAFWVDHGLLDMLDTIESTSHFGKRPIARAMTTIRSHVDTKSANSY